MTDKYVMTIEIDGDEARTEADRIYDGAGNAQRLLALKSATRDYGRVTAFVRVETHYAEYDLLAAGRIV